MYVCITLVENRIEMRTQTHIGWILAAMVAAAICKHYNIAMFSWASTAVPLSDNKRYDTTVRVISSALRYKQVSSSQ